ncbi:hypothetical protein [Halobacillus sp. Cin3]|uniref:hypothetical protein n=1 Tax=Halobacillus sp. Cin3 TaxID=2928441 RepID=UPI00248E2E3F|nr:hypothetical protein [Halobacillus sp. Cin3]
MPYSALYRFEAISHELNARDIDSVSYKNKYKGNLYCTTENCDAKFITVFRFSRPNYFRTHPKEDHNEDCIYSFERSATRSGIDSKETINVRMSENQKRNALKRAYRLSKMSEEEIERKKQKEKEKRNKSKITSGKKANTRIKNTLSKEVDEEKEAVALKKQKAPSLFNRAVDAINDSDLNNPRIVTGEVVDVYSEKNFAVVRISKGKRVLTVKFEEAFFADTPNYDGLFENITKYAEKKGILTFIGIGEIRKSSKNDEYELVIFNGNDFNIEGNTLGSLSGIVAKWKQ